MRHCLAAALALLAVTLSPRPSAAEEIGFWEDFALAADREQALKQLIPGTEEYYYFHCLHYQNTEQYDKVGQLMKLWVERHNRTPRYREIETRRALLTYGLTPQQSLQYIRNELKLRFDHKRQAAGQKPNLPTGLNPQLISQQALLARALQRKDLSGFEQTALEWLAGKQLGGDKRRLLLQQLQRPDVEGLVELVDADLRHPRSGGFGTLAIHSQMLRGQLDQLLKLQPQLLNNSALVRIYISKLAPGADEDWQHNPEVKRAYLERLQSFVSRLGPVHNSLKAHVLYQRLAFDRSQGVYDRERFNAYLKLPRNVGYVNPEYLKREELRQHICNLGQQFPETSFPPVGDDEPLVRSYLLHFFVEDASYDDYLPLVRTDYLKQTFAEAKVVNGVGNPEQWYSLLPPAKFQALKDRVDLDFDPAKRRLFAAQDPVSLDLHVKNVETLLVKVFQINTDNYYRSNGRTVNTDIELDGLVPNWQREVKYDEPPLRRVRRHFEFPELAGPGVYVIDFIGNGKNSRAVVQKGLMRVLSRSQPGGQVLTVLNEDDEHVRDASVYLGGKLYPAGEDGLVAIPYSAQPGRKPVVVRVGETSYLAHVSHQAEQYALRAGIYVDRELLLARRQGLVVLRPQLTLNGTPVSLDELQETSLTIVSTDLDGVSSTQHVSDFKLYEDRETIHQFLTPNRLASLQVTVEGRVKLASKSGDKVRLSTSQTFQINEFDRSNYVADMHLAWIDNSYALMLLGRTGEPLADRAVQLDIKHRDFTQTVQTSLQTDQQGAIKLGQLTDIAWVAAKHGGLSRTWQLRGDNAVTPSAVHGRVGETIELPLPAGGQVDRQTASLLEVRGGHFVSDQFAKMKLDGGLLKLTGLAAGDYDLQLKQPAPRQIRVRVTEGPRRVGYLLGDTRYLESRRLQPLAIGSAEVGKDRLVVQLQNATKFSRVHVIATRFTPALSAYDALGGIGDPGLYLVSIGRRESLFAEGRQIGEEYRYILERQLATKFPGNMLERPSLLLNPWVLRTTESKTKDAAGGGAFGAKRDPKSDDSSRDGRPGEGRQLPGMPSSVDFLAEPAVTLRNLRPDENGRIVVELDALGGGQHVRVIAADPLGLVERQLSLPQRDWDRLDLRLAGGLDPQKHFVQRQAVSTLEAGETIRLSGGATRMRTYDSLGSVFRLMTTLHQDQRLEEFRWVLQWPGLSDEQRREKYSKFACHELNFFLKHKDPKFFADVVRPYLANKRDRTFLDQWLLDETVTGYTGAWRHGQLNIVERILIGHQLRQQAGLVERHVQELFELIPPDPQRNKLLFQTAISSGGLEADEMLSIGGALDSRANGKAVQMMNGQAAGGGQAPGREAMNMLDRNADYDAQRDIKGAEKLAQSAPAPPALQSKSQARFRAQGQQQAAQSYFSRGRRGKVELERLYEQLDKTKEWAENNYYKRPIEEQNGDLVTVDAFWNDYARHPLDKPFLSRHFMEAAGNTTEIMLALAVLDLPFEAGEHEQEFEGQELKIKAGSRMIVLHEELQPAGLPEGPETILVSQNFFQLDDRYRYENNQRLDKYVTDEFLAQTAYGCQIVVTNPTSAPRQLEVLFQIPVGAIPVGGGKITDATPVKLDPYATMTVERLFYFPAVGEYPHFPVHVSQQGDLLAGAEPAVLRVVEALSRIDRESWDYISQNGTDADVLNYLENHNLQRTSLDKIAFRMADKDFFLKVVEMLGRRRAYNHTLWSYGVQHDVPRRINEFLLHENDFVLRCGMALDSELLTVDPVERRLYQHLDYRPLVNARAHQLGARRQILNDRLHGQYHRLLQVLACQRELSDAEMMSVTYYLLLQDRVEEALEFFGRVNRERLETNIQYDYFTAYTAMYTADTQQARDVAERYADYPVDRWNEAFAAVRSQLDEIEGAAAAVVDPEDRDQQLTSAADKAPGVELKVEAKKVRLDYRNVSQIEVRYYLMDVELLFSRNPFVQQHGGSQFSYIQPNLSAAHEVERDGKGTLEFDLPGELHNRNVLVEVRAGGVVRTVAYYSNSMTTQVVERFGRLRVTGADGKPASKVYVKAYARLKNGGVKFYKDGYTDLRGRFDYSSLSTNELDQVDRFALLILSDEQGAEVREAAPPREVTRSMGFQPVS